ncbi:hypothetical protein JCM9279_001503 [Rhodotorula babjevae]
MSSAPRVACATLGLFILDRFEWRTLGDDGTVQSTKCEDDIVGGGGTYAILGARMWLPAPRVGIVVDRGNDWPDKVERELRAYGEDMWEFRDKPEEPTTRALNLYTGEHRDFQYLTPRKRLEPKDLPPRLRTAEYLHFVCSPTRSLVIASQLSPDFSPSLVYEPIPDRCVPAELPALREVLPRVKVFSPNHEEAAAFFGIGVDEVGASGRSGIEEVARRFFALGAADVVLIRSGPLGAYAVRRGRESEGVWVPAYHSYEDGRATGKVVDVTGAGNSFLGGLMAGLVRHPDDLVSAVQCASISASFTIEQFGLAHLSLADDGTELWNGVDPAVRLDEMRRRQQQQERVVVEGDH